MNRLSEEREQVAVDLANRQILLATTKEPKVRKLLERDVLIGGAELRVLTSLQDLAACYEDMASTLRGEAFGILKCGGLYDNDTQVAEQLRDTMSALSDHGNAVACLRSAKELKP